MGLNFSKNYDMESLIDLGFSKGKFGANNWSTDIYNKDVWVEVNKNLNNLYRVTISQTSSIPSWKIGETADGIDIVDFEPYDANSDKLIYKEPTIKITDITGDICDQGTYQVDDKKSIKILKHIGIDATTKDPNAWRKYKG